MKQTRITRHLFLAGVFVCQSLAMGPAGAQSSPLSIAHLRENKPYRYVGLVSLVSGGEDYIGSGTVIKPYSVLTAGHNLYSEEVGWSTNVVFERAYDYGSAASRSSASKLFILGGYASLVNRGRSETNNGFSRDMGGIVFYSRPAKGFYANWKKSTKLLTGSAYNMSLGYGAVVHSGEEMLKSSPTRPFYKVSTSFYENRSYGIESGMSGGPVFARSGGKWYVCAVNVSGPVGDVFDRGAGVRAIDADAATMIKRDLK